MFASAAVSLLVFGTKPLFEWNQVLGQSPAAVERVLGKPVERKEEAIAVYDQRRLLWQVPLRNSSIKGFALEIRWEGAPEDDLSLRAYRTPTVDGKDKSLAGYVGAPLSRFKGAYGKPVVRETSESEEFNVYAETYRHAELGTLTVESYELQKGKPVVTSIRAEFDGDITESEALRRARLSSSKWKLIPEPRDVGYARERRINLGPGRYIEAGYKLSGFEVQVRYFGLKGAEQAAEFQLIGSLGGLQQGAGLVKYPISAGDVQRYNGTESAYTRPGYGLTFSTSPKAAMRVFLKSFDPNDLAFIGD